jgi:uncharacterized membrane protein YedE/YeeE
MTFLFALIVGVLMGVLIQRVGASSPGMIARNLRLENLSVIKFMALTIAVGAVATYTLALFLPMHFDIKPLYMVGVLVGGLVFGVGFAVAGYCPGTCVVGIGEGRRDALFALLGGITGALVFTLAYPMLKAALIARADFGKVTLATALGIPGLVGAIALAAVLIAVVTLVPTVLRRDTPHGHEG